MGNKKIETRNQRQRPLTQTQFLPFFVQWPAIQDRPGFRLTQWPVTQTYRPVPHFQCPEIQMKLGPGLMVRTSFFCGGGAMVGPGTRQAAMMTKTNPKRMTKVNFFIVISPMS